MHVSKLTAPTKCPHCEANLSLSDSYSNITIEDNVATQRVYCLECDAIWHEHYTFSHYTLQ